MSFVLIDHLGSAVVHLTLNRPDARNALSADMCNDIVEAFEEIDRNKDARVVLLSGEGTVFCSGADIGAVSGPGGLEFLPAFERMLETVSHFRLPTVAAIQGAALGGGLQLATVCDFRIASDGAKIGIPAARLGIVVNFENVQRLVMLVGPPTTKEVLLTARIFSAQGAKEKNLVTRVVPEGHLVDEAQDYAEAIALSAPLSVQGAKRAIQVVLDDMASARKRNPAEVSEIDTLVSEAYNSSDLAEGLQAFSEKREPNFRGR
ncbi:MAG TPA: enoyl-CoA hydratase/isomerase family protein [Actinomycetota bacterium]|nr:enoyl-CoA hydratase/isomerase family protein [Actinomycetota bacterium]